MTEGSTAEPTLARDSNQRKILAMIRENGPISRAELARRSHLSRSTISIITADLLSHNHIFELGVGDSQGGRRPMLLGFNDRSSVVVGVELASSELHILIADLRAHILGHSTAAMLLGRDTASNAALIASHISAALAEVKIARSQVSCVAVGVFHQLAGGAVPNADWDDTALRSELSELLGTQVLIDHGAYFGALAEHTWGAARNHLHLAYIHLGNARVSGGLILDGQVYRGDNGAAGDIGHLTIDEDGPRCDCGSFGCLEAMIGAPGVLAQARAHGCDVTTITELLALAHEGHVQATAVITRAGTLLGVAVAQLIYILNPGIVVVGGELAQAGDLLLRSARETVLQRGLVNAAQAAFLAPGLLGKDVIARGAVAWAIRSLFESANDMNATHQVAISLTDASHTSEYFDEVHASS